MRRRVSIPNYRRLTGRPQRGIARPHASWKAMVEAIRRRAERLERDGADLARLTADLRQQLAAGRRVETCEVAAEAFALMAEALRVPRGIRYYDVQLQAGLVLAAGAVAEIQTGEGKTVVTALPALLHALKGEGVHVGTTNEYLSGRDFDELAPAYRLLGLRPGRLAPQAPAAEKREAYLCDVTYGPGYEFGFDFLRDQLAVRSRVREPLGARHLQRLAGQQLGDERLMQRGLVFAVVDEADSVLIDEAATPLILSGLSPSVCTDPESYRHARDLVERLEQDRDFRIDRGARAVSLTIDGWERIHQQAPPPASARIARPWSKIVENAIRARHLLQRDVDYVVRDGQVLLVDQNTGRIHPERTWRDGLHQAVEVLQNLEPTAEKETQARITRQRLCRLYPSVCGLTGTARGGEAEFREFYDLPVVEIPTHRPCRRVVEPARFFATREAKIAAIVDDIRRRRQLGRPVLAGTRTIEASKRLSQALSAARVSHTVLNGLQDASEAEIVAQAGGGGRVTVATNMAGRGTDIRLAPRCREIGGLHVLAAEFHGSSRIDRQLAGRAARQGDPGSCQFFASAEDELIADHAPALGQLIVREAAEGEHPADLTPAVRRVQSRLDRVALASRRRMVEHDRWIESVQSSLARRA